MLNNKVVEIEPKLNSARKATGFKFLRLNF